MALKMTANGQYVIKTRKQAVEALEAMQTLKQEIAEIRKEHGLDELEQDAVEMKKAATAWMVANDETTLQASGFHGTLIRATYDKRWLTVDDDLVDAGLPVGAISLRRIIRKKFKDSAVRQHVWNRITKRVADPEGIDLAINEGLISLDDVAPAYVEKEKTPYLRIFED